MKLECLTEKEMEQAKRGLWMPTMLQVGDTVGIREPDGYMGFGTVKKEQRGIILEFVSLGHPQPIAAIVAFGMHFLMRWMPGMPYPQGTLMIFLRDLLFYERPEVSGEGHGSATKGQV